MSHTSNKNTWCLPLVKQRLLAGERLTQPAMLEATNGQAWRLSAAIYYLTKSRKWDIQRQDDTGGIRIYYLEPKEIVRIKQELKRTTPTGQVGAKSNSKNNDTGGSIDG